MRISDWSSDVCSSDLSQFDVKVYYGDGTRVDLLRRAGAEKVQIIAFCIDGDGLDAQALGPVLEAFPQAAVFVRAYDRRHLLRLGSLDLAGTVREVFEDRKSTRLNSSH